MGLGLTDSFEVIDPRFGALVFGNVRDDVLRELTYTHRATGFGLGDSPRIPVESPVPQAGKDER